MKNHFNDVSGFLQKLLNEASIVPSGVPDTVLASDYWDALVVAIDARIAALPEFSGGGVVSMLFYQSSAPTGWTQNATHDDKMPRIVSGAGGGVGGSSLISTGVPAHTHTISTDGAHVHQEGAAHGAGWHADALPERETNSKGDHSHGGATGSQLAWVPLYVDVIICSKD